jgi:hypothetical protein
MGCSSQAKLGKLMIKKSVGFGRVITYESWPEESHRTSAVSRD